MMKPREVAKGVYLIGGAGITDPWDCLIYLIDMEELILIDTGCGQSVERIIYNIRKLKLNPVMISTIFLTHSHIDHIGGAAYLKKRFGAKVIAHSFDSNIIEKGDREKSGAYFYGMDLEPVSVDIKIYSTQQEFSFGEEKLLSIHTPGHTPGSISIYLERDGKKIIFAQDVHGPFMELFDSNLSDWASSMRRLLSIKPDILCEGHFGIYQPYQVAKRYIESQLIEQGYTV